MGWPGTTFHSFISVQRDDTRALSEIDRTKSEAELRLAIRLPLSALAVALGT
jgi:hypothetical protein